jgi:hypothetical protein
MSAGAAVLTVHEIVLTVHDIVLTVRAAVLIVYEIVLTTRAVVLIASATVLTIREILLTGGDTVLTVRADSLIAGEVLLTGNGTVRAADEKRFIADEIVVTTGETIDATRETVVIRRTNGDSFDDGADCRQEKRRQFLDNSRPRRAVIHSFAVGDDVHDIVVRLLVFDFDSLAIWKNCGLTANGFRTRKSFIYLGNHHNTGDLRLEHLNAGHGLRQ